MTRKTIAEELYDAYQARLPPHAQIPWTDRLIGEDEHQRWKDVANVAYRLIMETFAIPPLKHGTPRVAWSPNMEGGTRLSALVTEEDPIFLMGVDSGLVLTVEAPGIGTLSTSQSAAVGIIVRAVRTRPAPQIVGP